MPSIRPGRRAFLGTLAAGAGAALLGGTPAAADTATPATATPATNAAAPTPETYAALRAKAAALITGVPFDPADPAFAAPLARLNAAATELRAGLNTAAGRTSLWADLPLTGVSGDIASSYQRLRTLAVAWATPGSALHGDDTLTADLLGGLDFLHARAYNESKRETGNWWHWEIGAPRALMDTCVLMHEVISDTQRAAWIRAVDRFCPNPDRRTNLANFAETGANRADKALIVALRGAVGDEPAKLALARDGLSDVRDGGRRTLFGYVSSGDGYYADGSFIQHDVVAYTGSYGVVLLQSVSAVLGLLGGSPWQVTDPAVAVVLDAVERTYAPWIHDGLMMDSVRGRAVSRQFNRDSDAGRDTVDAILQLAAGAPEPYATRFRCLAKGWIERGEFLASAGIAATARAGAVLADARLTPVPRPTAHHVFAAMDRVVHRRPGWSMALSLSSRRIAMYECGNGENYRAWYQGDGVTYLHTDTGHYADDYWPTVNSYRLPGTTVDTRHRDPAVSSGGTGTFRPANAWAGGVAAGTYGLASLDLMAAGTTLRARKSWVFLDDAVVCLGAGITSGDGRPIETVVENRGTTAELTTGQDGRWAHLDGVGGYVFPSGSSGLRTLRERRADSWRAINDGASTGGGNGQVARDYVTLWLDHGANPANAAYAYILLPTASLAQTEAFDRAEVLANTAEVQAVRAHGRSVGRGVLLAATFWAAGAAGGVTASAPCAVLVRQAAGRITVAVSDPGRTVSGVTVTLDHPAHRLIAADPTVTVVPGERPAITVNLAGSRGRTHTAELAVGRGA
ncbi:polysaccharide lyase 8 family protein [Nonomuraea sp. NN258]|uniref:polysaccharide lyase 8 family protein n=1 Tax=Nonomuraea antri TaxID=2730852 RepID=UPI00156A6558|nr:polysaccharide lyase 8 family protein [Nonomuraea antri]NRQ32791.1 polysaccharide lyase 8 family protein [Nonomuraea antri]